MIKIAFRTLKEKEYIEYSSKYKKLYYPTQKDKGKALK